MRPRNLLFSLAALAGFAAGTAAAEDTVCTELETQLSRLDAAPGDAAANQQRLSVALARESRQYRAAYDEADRAGCLGGGFLFEQAQPDVCHALLSRLEQAQARMAGLEARQQPGAFDPGGTDRQRRSLLTALAVNGCGPQYAAYEHRGSLLDSVFGNPAAPPDSWGEDWSDPYAYSAPAETFRTLCVRTCDGYYFPVSFAATPDQFDADAMACASMCPGTEVALYSHRNPGEDVEAAVTSDGRRYANLPAAFAYRDRYDPACTCHWALASAATATGDARAAAPVPLPLARPRPGDDPETSANRLGRLHPVAVPDAGREEGEVAGRLVRQVGPSYFYAR